MTSFSFVVCLVLAAASSVGAVSLKASGGALGAIGAKHEEELLQSYEADLNGQRLDKQEPDTPVTRVLTLLKDLQTNLQKEQKEDIESNEKFVAWCKDTVEGKTKAVADGKAKITELETTVSGLQAKQKELGAAIKELNKQVEAGKQALAEATSIREEQLKKYQSEAVEGVKALNSLKSALTVLDKKQGTALPQLSLLQLRKDADDVEAVPESSAMQRLDDFMSQNGYSSAADSAEAAAAPPQKFLQANVESGDDQAWSEDDKAVLRTAMRTANSFMQAQGMGSQFPAYASQSGTVIGILKQLKDQMEADAGQAEKTEKARAASFVELKQAKATEVEAGEKMAAQKKDELAQADFTLASSDRAIAQERTALAENEKYLASATATCAEGKTNFDDRSKARTEEQQAVAEALAVLTEEKAKAAIAGTYKPSFLQISHDDKERRNEAAAALWRAAARTGSPELSMLATAAQLDAFTKVRKAIDDMVATMKQQQADEVKKNDWCKQEIATNERAIEKVKDRRNVLKAKSTELLSNIKTLEDGIKGVQEKVAQLQKSLQSASEARKKENSEFQKTVADQKATQQVLKEASAKLAAFYKKKAKALVQQAPAAPTSAAAPAAPPQQKQYAPSQTAGGVLNLLEKLVAEAEILESKSRKAENAAQAGYEQLVANTFSAIDTLQQEITTKSSELAATKKDQIQADTDIKSSVTEEANLAKMGADLHSECDTLTQNFDKRQASRLQEIEALGEAKDILRGAKSA